jgi:hypothetical protein
MIRVRPMQDDDSPWVIRRLKNAFGDATFARKGASIDASVLPGFVAAEGGRPVGFLTYEAAHGEFEVVAIISVEEGRGSPLLPAMRDEPVCLLPPRCAPLPEGQTIATEARSRRHPAGARAGVRAAPGAGVIISSFPGI